MKASTETSTANLTLHFEQDGCEHDWSVRLGCEPHEYKHLWGWACTRCWQQEFYPDLDVRCEVTIEDTD